MAAEGFATLLHIMLSEAPGGFQIILFSLSICVVPLGQPIHRCGIATVVPFLREVLHPPNGLRQLLVILRSLCYPATRYLWVGCHFAGPWPQDMP